jgi:hypothetical protein
MRKFAKEEWKRWEEITQVLKDYQTNGLNRKTFEELFQKINHCSEGAKAELVDKFHIQAGSIASLHQGA